MANSEYVEIDATGYRDRVGATIPPGRYTVVVDDAESDVSSNGNPMINTWLKVVGGEMDGSTIVDRMVLTPKSLFRVMGFMAAIGLPTPRKKLRLNLRSIIGKALDVDVDDGEPYMGRVKSEIRGYLKASGSVPKAEESDLEDLDEQEPEELEAEDVEQEEAPAPKPKAEARPKDKAKPAPEPEADDDDEGGVDDFVANEVDLDTIDL